VDAGRYQLVKMANLLSLVSDAYLNGGNGATLPGKMAAKQRGPKPVTPLGFASQGKAITKVRLLQQCPGS
jgi:hypothetical protein